MRRLALLLLMACASARPSRDSPQFRACVRVCEDEGAKGASVVEDEDSIVCVCKKPPETT